MNESPGATSGVVPSTRLFVAAVIGSSAAKARPGRYPHLRVRVPGPTAERDRRIVLGHQCEPALAAEEVQVVEGAPADPFALPCRELCRPRREPELVEREMRARGQPQVPLAAGRARQPQVGVPPERHRDPPAAGGDDRRVERERLFTGDDGDLDAVRIRERRRVHVDRGPETCPLTAGRAAIETPSRFAHEETVDRETVGVGAEREAGQVDVDAGGTVVARPQPVRPWGQQGEAQAWRPSAARAGHPAVPGAHDRGTGARHRSTRGQEGTWPRALPR